MSYMEKVYDTVVIRPKSAPVILDGDGIAQRVPGPPQVTRLEKAVSPRGVRYEERIGQAA